MLRFPLANAAIERFGGYDAFLGAWFTYWDELKDRKDRSAIGFIGQSFLAVQNLAVIVSEHQREQQLRILLKHLGECVADCAFEFRSGECGNTAVG